MKLSIIQPAKALNRAYFKQSLKREQIELFKTELQNVFNHTDEKQDEEYHKNLISQFLLSVYCKDKYLVNVNKRQDLVIRLGNNTTDNVGVILEFKKPTEKKDMVSADKPNVKALQGLVLYYLRETIDNDNHQIKHLITTNINEWFIFDEVWFEKNIFRNSKLKKEYQEWKVSGHDTKHFYELIAAKHLDTIEEEVSCTYFNLKEFEKIISNPKKADDNKLIDLYKILSPEHLLKKSFANDSNTLNKEFYNELLHLIGLEETKEGSKKLIGRKQEKDRNDGSLIENAITILKRKKFFGYTDTQETEHKYFDIALELCIIWLNRILFLKLLEGQLIKYHRGNTDFTFLNINKIVDYDILDELFFEVLALEAKDRSEFATSKFKNVPYLNSSLFEQSEMELQYIGINQLKDRLEMPIYNSTVLKDTYGKRISGNKNPLVYLYEFLDAYDFASDSAAQIQEQNKNIINASVLGLIFEKINGYKDGSFFTPGFITMYMCRETIRKAVLQKFNDTNKWKCKDFSELKDKIDHTNKQQRQQSNDIINSLKICDIAVGSGHFLVSALNELIAVKHDLQILNYRDGSRVKGFRFEIANDELVITNEETDQLFEYTLNQNSRPIDELQQLQEALFHEKQHIIENCLFGVDINPKSVTICRLRLWIELLKNSYYTKESKYEHLETLPNIDINIKCGNSLISRFALDDKNSLLPKDRPFVMQLTEKYKVLVDGYKNAHDKKAKDDFRRQIGYIKTEFEKFVIPTDKEFLELKELKDKLGARQFSFFFEESEKAKWVADTEELSRQVTELEKQYTEKLKTIYGNSFEWRFEFPEVLNNEGQFKGFDVVIGNPPYIGIEDITWDFRRFYETIYKTATGRFDLYSLFIEKAMQVKQPTGVFTFIIPGKFLNNKQFVTARKIVCDNHGVTVVKINDKVFDDAQVDSVIVENYPETNAKYKALKITSQELQPLSETDVASILQDKEIIFRLEINTMYDNLISKIENDTLRVREIADVKDGIVAGTIKDLLFLDKKLDKDSHKLYFGKHLSKYHLTDTDVWVNYKPDEMMEAEVRRKEGKRAGLWMRDEKIFKREKILSRFVAKEVIATYDDKKKYYEHTLHSTHIIDKKFRTKFVLALFNSTLFKFYYRKTNSQGGDIFPQVRISSIENLPIKLADSKMQDKFEKLVNQILTKKEKNAATDTTNLENKIDELVYQLYGLTEAEIKMIEEK